ncbi:hypothetical protein PPYR_04897 [Photinus pyralis]|uniref:Uncharacterized protein n=1 Tax=Photinus pyralis TaxID=7054 RepID=A0A5N4AZD3_PHOPY|nr:hypothetical protein PPYR_04897 [Photinus pyralis]
MEYEGVREITTTAAIGIIIVGIVHFGLLVFFFVSIIVLCVKVKKMRKILDSHTSLLQFRLHEGTQHPEDELAKRYAMPPRTQHSELSNNQYRYNPNFPSNQSHNLRRETETEYGKPLQLPRAQHPELKNSQYPSNSNFPPKQAHNLKGETDTEYGKHGPSMVMMHYPKPKRTNGHYH